MKTSSPNFTDVFTKFRTEIFVGFLFLLAYVPTFLGLWDRWFAVDSYYSHGILIPFVSAFFIWKQRRLLAEIPRSSSPWGFRFIVIGLIIHLLSANLRINFTSGFSFLIVLIGFVLHFWGTKIFRKIWFPVCFVFFMLPLPLIAITGISFRLKIIAATIAAKLLNHLGIQAVRDGSMIYMRHAYVVVEDVCSGLRSLISLLALGSVFAYLFRGPAWKKIVIVAMAVPIAVITNVCRVIILSVISEIWGSQYAEGFIHDATGFLVFALAFILLMSTVNLLEEENK